MPDLETIPLPEERIKEKEPVWLEVRPEAWSQRMRLTFDWNATMERWVWGATLVGEGELIPDAPVILDHPFDYRDYIRFMFIDPSGNATEITPQNLGDPVVLAVGPLEDSPAYPYDLTS